MDKVRALENLAYQLGVEEGEHMIVVFVCVCVGGGVGGVGNRTFDQ